MAKKIFYACMVIQLIIVYIFRLSLLQLRDVSTVTGEQAESRKKRVTKVVKRLVFLMCAYGAITALTYAPICALQQHSKRLEYHIKQYFGCLVFQPPEKCPRSKYYISTPKDLGALKISRKGFTLFAELWARVSRHYHESSDFFEYPKDLY